MKLEVKHKVTGAVLASVKVLTNHIKIGCQTHTIEAWENFTDDEIFDMDGRPGLRWWGLHKEQILGMAR